MIFYFEVNLILKVQSFKSSLAPKTVLYKNRCSFSHALLLNLVLSGNFVTTNRDICFTTFFSALLEGSCLLGSLTQKQKYKQIKEDSPQMKIPDSDTVIQTVTVKVKLDAGAEQVTN